MKERQNKYRDGGGSSRISPLPQTGTTPVPIKMLPYAVGVFGIAFLASCITASVMTPVQNSDAASQIQASVDDSGYYANVTASDVVELDVIATLDGGIKVVKDTVTTTTNSATGYMLYISSDSATSGANNMAGTGDASGYHLSPVAGTTTTPIQLTENSWGYSLTTLPGNNGEVTEASKFIGMPLLNSENLLHTRSTAATSGDSIDVYYGAKATTALASGYYTSRVVYTIVAEGSPATEDRVSLSDNEATSLTPTKNITVATGLYTSASNVGTVSVTIGGQACTNVTKLNTSTGEIKVTCDIPAQDDWGDYDVVVSIPKYEKSYTMAAAFHYYVPWDDMQYMQDMTTYACGKVSTPSAFTGGDTTPTYAYTMNGNTIYDANLTAANLVSYWSGTAANGSNASYLSYGYVANVNTSVPEKNLIDLRDGNSYRIRKLADGNCWMTQNLRLVFSDDAGTIGYVQNDGTIAAKGAQTYTRTVDGSTITVAANHKIDEDLSNVGKNAVGGASASNWSSSLNADFAYTEIINTGATTNRSYWGSSTTTPNPKHPTTSTDIGWNATSSDRSMAYPRSIYNGTVVQGCSQAAQPNHNTNYSNNCQMKDGDSQITGTMYNWRSATAGTGTLSVSTDGTNMTDSVCPKGWQLPTNTGSKSYGNLINVTYAAGTIPNSNIDARNNVGAGGTPTGTGTSGYYQTLAGYHVWAMTNAMRMAPLSLPFAGYYYFGGSVNNVGGGGYYWSATAASGSHARRLLAYAGLLYPQSSDVKGFGLSVRCVAQ